jgi:hypothetical protein
MADFPQLSRLVRRADSVAESASALVRKTLREIRGELANLSGELNLAGNAEDREKVYAEIRRRMALLARRMNTLMEAQNEAAAKGAVKSAASLTGLEVKYSPSRAKAICELVTPAQGENLAAVFTDRMGRNLINSLREATVGMLREQAVAGGTMKDMSRDLAERWSKAAKEEDPKFTDSAGRAWNTKTYIQMNVRTNTMRVYNDVLADTVARETGGDLMRISTGGDQDCDCAAWEGCIISLTGKTKGFPTYEDARNGGCFHPNCTHTLEYVDETVDVDEIELQKSVPADAENADDYDAQDERKYEIDQARYMRDNPGMTKEEARVAVDRDNLAASIQSGLVREDAREIVAKMTDAQVTALCPDGNPPAFEPTKKATRADPHAADEKWNHGSNGGVVHIARNASAEQILEVCKVKDAQPPEEPPKPDEWQPSTDLERSTDAIMREIGATHTSERQDPMKGNPEYGPGDAKRPYRINCQRCVPTAEARLRGYDVVAQPRPMVRGRGGKMEADPNDPIFRNRSTKAEYYFSCFKNPAVESFRSQRDIERCMADWGDGARAQICCLWKGGGAHTFIAIQENGRTRFMDPQTGREDCTSYFHDIKTRGRNVDWNTFARIDTLEFSDNVKLALKPNPSK